jgi:hypothetical protein
MRSCAPLPLALLLALALPACGSNEELLDEADREAQAVLAVKSFIQLSLDDFAGAAAALQDAAPAPDADGWSATADADAVFAMKTEWKRARQAYERVEGAIAVVFPDLDVATDARYDAFIEAAPDDDLFDDEGVTGVHAIERILWSDSIPPEVIAFESALPNYTPPAFPSTQAEADAFKNDLCARLAADTRSMQEQFRGLALDAPSAYRGVIGSMREQVEKLAKAATARRSPRRALSPRTCAPTCPPARDLRRLPALAALEGRRGRGGHGGSRWPRRGYSDRRRLLPSVPRLEPEPSPRSWRPVRRLRAVEHEATTRSRHAGPRDDRVGEPWESELP